MFKKERKHATDKKDSGVMCFQTRQRFWFYWVYMQASNRRKGTGKLVPLSGAILYNYHTPIRRPSLRVAQQVAIGAEGEGGLGKPRGVGRVALRGQGRGEPPQVPLQLAQGLAHLCVSCTMKWHKGGMKTSAGQAAAEEVD